MDTLSSNSSVPAFLRKLKNLIDDPETDDVISWDNDGKSFHIYDGNKLAKQVLPMYFKHNNLSSFIRQLNMYGFRKVNNLESGSVFHIGMEDMEFSHHYFIRDIPDLMQLIARKTTVQPGLDMEVYSKPENNSVHHTASKKSQNAVITSSEWEQLLNTVRHIKQRQNQTETRMKALKEENEHYYRELTDMKSKHIRQTRIIESMMQLFQGFVKNSRNLAIPVGDLLSITEQTHSSQPSQSLVATNSNKVPRIITVKANNGSSSQPNNYNIITHSGAVKRKAPYTVEFPTSVDNSGASNSNMNIVEIPNSNRNTPEWLDSPPTIQSIPVARASIIANPPIVTSPDLSSPPDFLPNKRQALEYQRTSIGDDVNNMEAEIDGLRDYLRGNQFNQYEFSKIFNSNESADNLHINNDNNEIYVDDPAFYTLAEGNSESQLLPSYDNNRITGGHMSKQNNYNSSRERNEIVAANLFPPPSSQPTSIRPQVNKMFINSSSPSKGESLITDTNDNLPEVSDDFLNSLLDFESSNTEPVSLNKSSSMSESLNTPLIPTSNDL